MAPKKRTPGNVVEIDLHGLWAYAQVINSALTGFYSARETRVSDIEQLNSASFVFKIWVMDYAIGKNGWPIIGNLELNDGKDDEPWFFKQDVISGALLKYKDSTQEEIEIAIDECAELECAAAWDPEHVESRLRDEYVGCPNAWVESMKPKDSKKAQQEGGANVSIT